MYIVVNQRPDVCHGNAHVHSVQLVFERSTVSALNLRRSNCASKLVTQKMYFLFLRHCRENLS